MLHRGLYTFATIKCYKRPGPISVFLSFSGMSDRVTQPSAHAHPTCWNGLWIKARQACRQNRHNSYWNYHHHRHRHRRKASTHRAYWYYIIFVILFITSITHSLITPSSSSSSSEDYGTVVSHLRGVLTCCSSFFTVEYCVDSEDQSFPSASMELRPCLVVIGPNNARFGAKLVALLPLQV